MWEGFWWEFEYVFVIYGEDGVVFEGFGFGYWVVVCIFGVDLVVFVIVCMSFY